MKTSWRFPSIEYNDVDCISLRMVPKTLTLVPVHTLISIKSLQWMVSIIPLKAKTKLLPGLHVAWTVLAGSGDFRIHDEGSRNYYTPIKVP